MHSAMNLLGKVDRLRFREFLHICFDITDDVMLDLTFRAFDRNSDGAVSLRNNKNLLTKKPKVGRCPG
jgi:hypothetical protein